MIRSRAYPEVESVVGKWMRRTQRWALFLGFACLTTGAGCSEELGPEPFKTTTVQGRVVTGRGPVTSGWIELFPTDGTMGNLATARIRPDGSFAIERAPVGRVAVSLVNIPPQPLPTPGGTVPTAIFQLGTSPIRRTIADVPNAPLEIDLGIEAVRYSESRQAQLRQRGGTGG